MSKRNQVFADMLSSPVFRGFWEEITNRVTAKSENWTKEAKRHAANAQPINAMTALSKAEAADIIFEEMEALIAEVRLEKEDTNAGPDTEGPSLNSV